MRTNNLIVFCIKCNGHYKWEETYKLITEPMGPMENKNLYICEGCYEALPQVQEINKMIVVK